MNKEKELALHEALEKFMDMTLMQMHITEDADQVIAKDIMGYGTTLDEVVGSFTEWKALINLQIEQGAQLDFQFDRTPYHKRISEREDTALIVETIATSIIAEGFKNEFTFRISVLLEYTSSDTWQVIHWHGSIPSDTENDSWHVNEWKKKNELLEKEVQERTVELEAKNRELEIEAALERVRSRSLAMHKSGELQDVIKLVFGTLKELELEFFTASIVIPTVNLDSLEYWIADKEQTYDTPIHLYNTEALSQFDIAKDVKNAWEEKLPFFRKQYTKRAKNNFWKYVFKNTDFRHIPEERKKFILNSEGYSMSLAITKNIFFQIVDYSGKQLNEDEAEILKRLARVFEQAYTRFNDLQKAETQAREAQIETALEKVRSRSMAMHNSEELLDVITVVSEQLLKLNFRFNHVSFANSDIDQVYKFWTSAPRMPKPMRLNVPHIDNPMFSHLTEAKQAGVKFFTDVITKEENIEYHEQLLKHSDDLFTKEENEYIISRGMARSIAINPNIILILANYASVPYSDEENRIIVRFGQVFEQSYTRFLDLQKAEAQAHEARVDTALEKVRSQTMGMQKSEDLLTTINVISEQLQQLGVRFHNVSFGINNKGKDYNFWMASPYQPYPYKLDIPYLANPMADRLQEAKNKKVEFFADTLTKEENLQWHKHVIKYGGDETFPEEVKDFIMSRPGYARSIVFMKNIFLTVGNYAVVPYSDEENNMFKRFANVFDQSYIRFLDLQKAEAHAVQAERDLIEIKAAREKAEEALTELQLTQKQLIQSEKMASLGELTAGIAHEIQNPLNFVNNFSEVSNEMIKEIQEERGKKKEDRDEALTDEILNDIEQNLEKINHHGKRAGDIVKGMLQHSRVGSGKKEPTDINVLCDEYLRLAYHGLRAKDKSFNSKFETDFDTSLPKIDIVPQDIGRVVLNLINNAFYAVNERAKLQASGYEPQVVVSTKKEGDKVLISIKDNGGGIPEHVREKIFQPFFTTKPTGQGTGLGLSLSYDIVKAHGGELKVETKEGEGSVFIIQLHI
jgi:signal transduction histidine kinase